MGVLVPGGSGLGRAAKPIKGAISKVGNKLDDAWKWSKNLLKNEDGFIRFGGKGSAVNKVSKYIDITETDSRFANRATNVTKSQFERILLDNGWTRSISKDGKVVNFTKDGAKYSLREGAKSTGGPTADFYKPGNKIHRS